MKTSLSAVMSSMTPQLALLAKLDRRVAAANLRAATERGAGGPVATLALADDLLARAAAGGGGVISGNGNVLIPEYEAGELQSAAKSFAAWADTISSLLPPLKIGIKAAMERNN